MRKVKVLRWEILCLVYNFLILMLVGVCYRVYWWHVLRFGDFKVRLILITPTIACVIYCLGPLRRACVGGDQSGDGVNDGFKEIVFSWEKLRLAGNLILLFTGLLILERHVVDAFTHNWQHILLFAVAVNAGYCLGPLIELSLAALLKLSGLPARPTRFFRALRQLLFLAGLSVSLKYLSFLAYAGVRHIEWWRSVHR